MRIAAKMMAGALLAGAVLAAPAQAQINYSTTGQFVSAFPGCGDPAPALVVSCTGGGFSLTFTGTGENLFAYDNGSSAFLGNFLLTLIFGATAGGIVWQLIIAIVGACLLIAIVRAVTGGRHGVA